MRFHHTEPIRLPSTSRLWFGVLAAPVAWFTHLVVAYGLAPLACLYGHRVVLDLTSLGTLLIASAGTFVAWRDHRALRPQPSSHHRIRSSIKPSVEPTPGAEAPAENALMRARFMTKGGTAMSLFFTLIIVVESLPIYLHDPCLKIEGPLVLANAASWLAWVLDAVLGGPAIAHAHVGEVVIAPEALWSSWNGDPWIIGGLLGAGACYTRGVHTLWQAKGRAYGIRPWQATAHMLGLATLALALLSPLDALSAALFSAHMGQHLLLMALAPPLLVLGHPARAYAWGMPRSWRRTIARVRRPAFVRALLSVLQQPWIALGLHTMAVWIWHAPGPYEAALRSELVHALEHFSFFGSSLLVWMIAARAADKSTTRTVILSDVPGHSVRRSRHAPALLLLFATMVQGGLLGLLATITPVAWYPEHSTSAYAWGLTPLEDQQLAGLLMWIPGALPYVIGCLLLFYSWLRTADRSTRARSAAILPRAAASLLLMASMMFAGGCEGLRDSPPVRQVSGGDPRLGREAIDRYGCGSCHVIPGIRRAVGRSAPPLTAFGDRGYVAGVLSNRPDHLIRWIVDPQGVSPGTAMPNVGVSESEARDMAAYLYTLRGN